MQYETIRESSEIAFVSVLNSIVDAGRRVVSAGASFNQTLRCLEWWAIVERPDKVTIKVDGVTEEIKEAGKRAELLEAARLIAENCRAHGNNCDACALWSNGCGCVAMVVGSGCTPDNWPIGEGGDGNV